MAKTLAELINGKFAIRVRPVVNPLIQTVDTTALQMLRNNPNRVAFVVFNLSSNNLYILHENTVSTTRGFHATASGGSIAVVWDEDFHLVGYEWWCVGDGAGTDFIVMEIESY